MERQSSREPRVADRRLSRRTLLRAGGAAAAGTLATGAAGVAGAQITTDAALPADAPTLDNDDYTGLFVDVGDRSDVDVSGVDACDFLDSGQRAVAFNVRLVDRIEDDSRSVESTLYAAEDNENVSPGQAFVINSQSQCSGDFVSVNLEQIEDIGDASVGTGEQATPRVEVSETGTEAATPGFGVLTAVTGLAAAAAVALGRARP